MEAFGEKDGSLRDQVLRGACEDDVRMDDSVRGLGLNCGWVPEGCCIANCRVGNIVEESHVPELIARKGCGDICAASSCSNNSLRRCRLQR